MRKLLALLVVLTVAGCSADATASKTETETSLKEETSAGARPSVVSTAAPTRAYLLKGRLHVGR